MWNMTSFLLLHNNLTPDRDPNNQMIGIYTHVALLLSLRRSLTFTRISETEYLKRPVRSCWGHGTVHADATPSPVMATFIEPRLICQSTFLLLRDRRTGRLSDCPSAVITFSTTCCSAAPQTPGKLPRPLTFPLEKTHMEMAVTGWHSTFYIWGEESSRNSLHHRLLPCRGLGFCDVDWRCYTWAHLWWSASCRATLGLMNKRSPKWRRSCTKSHDGGADARLRRFTMYFPPGLNVG